MRRILLFLIYSLWPVACSLFAQDVLLPNAAGTFYPNNQAELSVMIDGFIASVQPQSPNGKIFALIVPHAGYGYSGKIAAEGYKLIQDKPYKTVVIIGTSHQYAFGGVSVYPQGKFRTPLGDAEIDMEFANKLLNKNKGVVFEPEAFSKEHSVEVQIPFLQKTLSGFKIVPVVMGDCTLSTCQDFAGLLKNAIGMRDDVLVIVSTDMYHGYDYEEASKTDALTMAYLVKMDAEGLYYGLREGRLQLCGGFGAVTTLILAKELGHNTLKILEHTTSALVTGNLTKGIWTVGYMSAVIDKPEGENKGESQMLDKEQRKKLLVLARNSIEYYLKNGKKSEITETDPVLLRKLGAFVTLHKAGQLRGCIGNLVGTKPLYLTIRDMALEAAFNDPRFTPLESGELTDTEIEISVLSPMERIDSVDKIEMGKHGVLIKKGFASGVFLPQVATETGWSKEEFLSNLCAHKAGLEPDAWKDKSTDIYIFSAEVFSEKQY